MRYSWRPHSGFQTRFCSRSEFEVFGGGAAGPGKTDCLIAMALRYVAHPDYRGIIFRRSFPQLSTIIDRMRRLYPRAVPGAAWKETPKTWIFPSGAKIRLGHIQHEGDKYDYQGDEFQFVGFDELTHFTETQYLYLFSRCRRTADFPWPPFVRATSNPGGIGHAWVKRRFRIGNVAPGTPIFDEYVDTDTGEVRRTARVFIPGFLRDNPSVNAEEYIGNLSHLPEIERMRLLNGLWDAFEGQAFSELNPDVHGFDYDIPPEWEVFGSFDWGSAKPWSYGLYAINYDGTVFRFAEAYGAKQDENGDYVDEGLRQNDNEIAHRILALEQEYRVKPRVRVADPAIWAKRPEQGGKRGPSVHETMQREGVYFIKADNDRIAGRRQCHHRLALQEDGKPGFFVHSRCKSFWQTIPEMREDEKNPEDIVTKEVPDHCLHGDTLVMTSEGMSPIRNMVGTEGWVLSIDGRWVPYWDCRLTRRDADLVTVYLTNGEKITCTPDHRFMLPGGEWEKAGHMQGKLCYDAVSFLIREGAVSCELSDLVTRFKSSWGSAIISAVCTFRERASDFIEWCGKQSTAWQFRLDFISITWTVIGGTINPTTLCSSLSAPMPLTMHEPPTIPRRSKPLNLRPENGTAVKKGHCGIGSSTRSTAGTRWLERHLYPACSAESPSLGRWGANSAPTSASLLSGERSGLITKLASVLFAGIRSRQSDSRESSPAGAHVAGGSEERSVGVDRVESVGRGDVFCLVADDTHAFAVAPGVIVSNCYDEWRYALMSRPIRPKVAAKPDMGSFQAERRKILLARQYAAKHGGSMASAYGRVR